MIAQMTAWRDTSHAMSHMPTVVSYYTNTFYQREAFELVRSCQAFGLDYVVEQVKDLGSWEANTNYKPTFLLKQSRAFPNRPLLWLDADARVRQFPSLFHSLRVPVAYHLWQGKKPASGTVYLNIGTQRDVLLLAWEEEVRQRPQATDQVCLGRAVNHNCIHYGELPVDYCWVYDVVKGVQTVNVDPSYIPVIEHMQASRWTREFKRRGRK